MEAIRNKRNEEIRAYGRKVLEDADAALAAEQGFFDVTRVSDWDTIDSPQVVDLSVADNSEAIVSSESETGTEEIMDATAATEPQEPEEVKVKVDESPKPEPTADVVADVADVDAAELVEKPALKPTKAAPKRATAPSKE